MSMRNHHQQQQEEDQEPMDHLKNPNLETTHNHHHVPPSSSSQDFKKTHQDFKKTHHQHMGTHISHKTHEDDQGFIFKNATKVIKNPTFLSSSSSLAAGEGYTMPPPPPPSSLPPPPPPPPLPPQDFKKIHHVSNKINGNEGFTMENTNSLSCSTPLPPPPPPPEVAETVVEEEEDESVRDRITRHRVEMAGRVRIPDMWGHEDLLKDWIDCTVFDSNLGNKSIMSARAALVQERRSTLRIKNQC